MLGKRKREHAAVPRQSVHQPQVQEGQNAADRAELFRQYFEAKFQPLPQEFLVTHASNADEDEAESGYQSDTSDWSGITENEADIEEVRVIKHTVVSDVTPQSGASEGKYFLVCHSPTPSELDC